MFGININIISRKITNINYIVVIMLIILPKYMSHATQLVGYIYTINYLIDLNIYIHTYH